MMWNALALLAAVIVAAVPWGLPGETTFILPFLTLLLVFLFSSPRRTMMPAWLVFLAGLATDILTAGPLGYWAFLYTLCHALARSMAHRMPARSVAVLWLQFTLAAAISASAAWGLAALYYLRVIDWWPIALGAIAATLLCPFVALTLRRGLFAGARGPLAAEG